MFAKHKVVQLSGKEYGEKIEKIGVREQFAVRKGNGPLSCFCEDKEDN